MHGEVGFEPVQDVGGGRIEDGVDVEHEEEVGGGWGGAGLGEYCGLGRYLCLNNLVMKTWRGRGPSRTVLWEEDTGRGNYDVVGISDA